MKNENINDLTNKILHITSSKKLTAYFPNGYYNDPQLYLDTIFAKINNGKKKPIVVWNVRPSNNFNILHGIYCQKIKDFTDIGFNCIIILYDKLIENNSEFTNFDRSQLRTLVDKNVKWFQNTGINPSHIEFITETDIWSFVKYQDFASKFNAFSKLCDFDKKWKDKERIVAFIVENLWVLYYEDILNCDIALTGEDDAHKIWGMLRHKALKQNVIKDYSPPMILHYPNLNGLDKMLLNPSKINNTLSTQDTDFQIQTKIKVAPTEFLETVIDYLIIPYSNKLNHNGIEYISYKSIEAEIEIDEIKSIVTNFFIKYFKNINSQ